MRLVNSEVWQTDTWLFVRPVTEIYTNVVPGIVSKRWEQLHRWILERNVLCYFSLWCIVDEIFIYQSQPIRWRDIAKWAWRNALLPLLATLDSLWLINCNISSMIHRREKSWRTFLFRTSRSFIPVKIKNTFWFSPDGKHVDTPAKHTKMHSLCLCAAGVSW